MQYRVGEEPCARWSMMPCDTNELLKLSRSQLSGRPLDVVLSPE
jgi:hypothetical protein